MLAFFTLFWKTPPSLGRSGRPRSRVIRASSHAAQGAGRRNRAFVPRLESLEPRTVPATIFYWTDPNANGLWSNPNNWVTPGGVPAQCPQPGDILVFNPNLGQIAGVALANTSSIDDLAPVPAPNPPPAPNPGVGAIAIPIPPPPGAVPPVPFYINQLTVDASYTQSITLNQDLTINAALSYAGTGGVLDGLPNNQAVSLTVDPQGGNATVTWTGTTLVGSTVITPA